MRWKIILLILSFVVGSSAMGSELEEIRKAIREKGAKWTAGETSVSKLSPEERRRLLGDNLADEFPEIPGVAIEIPKFLPTEFDWRNKDGHFWMTPIKDQKNCGSCTAFGACGALEANLKICANNFWITPDLSEQHLFSCAGGDCDYGMSVSTAMNYLLNNGTPDEECLPYSQVDDNCGETCTDWQARARKISSWGWTDELIADIKSAIYNYGPVEGHFYVYSDFFSYRGGVYEYVWGDYEGGHAITMLGWSDSAICWICKNSWGEDWGEYGPYPDSTKGWFRIKYGECEIEDRKAAWMVPISKGPDGMVLDKESFEFALPPDSSDSDALQISNVGDSTFIFNITFNQPWLFVSPQSDTLDSNEVSLLDISVSSSGLLGGVYAGTLSVSARDPEPGEVPLYHFDVLVDLEVSCPFVRGDYDCDGVMLTNDPLMELQWIFGVPGAISPSCDDAADYDDDGNIFTNDPLMALQFIFGVSGSLPPAPPYPDCGYDPTPDDLYCASHLFCMGSKGVVYKPSVSQPGVKDRIVAEKVLVADGVGKVPIDLTVVEPVCGFDISLGYDASSLRFKEVVGGSGYDFYAVDTREEGVVRIGVVPDIEMIELMGAGTHRVGEVMFEMEKRADVELRWKRVEVYGSNVQPLDVEWVNGVVKAGVSNLPTEFALSQNYPNPFNPTTLIRYELPVDCQVRLEVYNVVGRLVTTLVDGHQKAGYKVARWDADSFPSGIYFYRLQAGDFVGTRKMVLLK